MGQILLRSDLLKEKSERRYTNIEKTSKDLIDAAFFGKRAVCYLSNVNDHKSNILSDDYDFYKCVLENYGYSVNTFDNGKGLKAVLISFFPLSKINLSEIFEPRHNFYVYYPHLINVYSGLEKDFPA